MNLFSILIILTSSLVSLIAFQTKLKAEARLEVVHLDRNHYFIPEFRVRAAYPSALCFGDQDTQSQKIQRKGPDVEKICRIQRKIHLGYSRMQFEKAIKYHKSGIDLLKKRENNPQVFYLRSTVAV